MNDFSDPDFEDGWTSAADRRANRAERELAALKRAHVALAEQAGRDQAAIARVRKLATDTRRYIGPNADAYQFGKYDLADAILAALDGTT